MFAIQRRTRVATCPGSNIKSKSNKVMESGYNMFTLLFQDVSLGGPTSTEAAESKTRSASGFARSCSAISASSALAQVHVGVMAPYCTCFGSALVPFIELNMSTYCYFTFSMFLLCSCKSPSSSPLVKVAIVSTNIELTQVAGYSGTPL